MQLEVREEKISQLMENMKGKQLLHILFYQIICLVLQSQVVQLHDLIKSNDPQLSEMFEKGLAIQQEPDDRVDDNDITSQSKI